MVSILISGVLSRWFYMYHRIHAKTKNTKTIASLVKSSHVLP